MSVFLTVRQRARPSNTPSGAPAPGTRTTRSYRSPLPKDRGFVRIIELSAGRQLKGTKYACFVRADWFVGGTFPVTPLGGCLLEQFGACALLVARRHVRYSVFPILRNSLRPPARRCHVLQGQGSASNWSVAASKTVHFRGG